jgi:hypothetical protein
MAENNSVLVDMRDFFKDEESKNYFPHMMVGIESNNEGLPIGAVIKVKASPLMTLGMADMLEKKLQEIRKEAYDRLEQLEAMNSGDDDDSPNQHEFQKALSKLQKHGLTDEDRKYLDESQDKALRCLVNGDAEGLKEILEDLKAYAKKRTGQDFSGDSEFNLNDFKGGF